MTGRLNHFIYRPLPMDWVSVPAGEFGMGSEHGNPEESPVHAVYLDNYEIGKYEVTNEQYYQCVKAGVCSLPRNPRYNSPEYVDHPVTDVSWIDANTFCAWNNPNGRLPTEAEWEKAARSADGRTYPWGERIDCSYTNYYDGNSYCVGNTTPAGSYESGKSPYGAYDMAGNVWEWVADWYSDTYYASSPESNPLGPENGNFRVLRGGSLLNGGYYLRSVARRAWISPTGTDSYVGFRCARDVSP